jgi:hypothetical protein
VEAGAKARPFGVLHGRFPDAQCSTHEGQELERYPTRSVSIPFTSQTPLISSFADVNIASIPPKISDFETNGRAARDWKMGVDMLEACYDTQKTKT